jgi:hypothetical protein
MFQRGLNAPLLHGRMPCNSGAYMQVILILILMLMLKLLMIMNLMMTLVVMLMVMLLMINRRWRR